VNDALDFKKGADKETRLGEARASQQGWFTHSAVLSMGLGFFALAAVFGAPLVWLGGVPILLVGVVSLLMGYAYTGGPFPLAYLGLGDLFVVIFFGVVAVMGVVFLQAQQWMESALIAGLQEGLLSTVMIAINNLRDLEQDRLVNKKTFAVRLGPKLGRYEVLVLILGAFALNFYWLARNDGYAFVLPLISLPMGLQLAWTVLKTEASPAYNRLLARGSFMHMLFGVLLSIGFFLV
jgi:1,4-dihydroxy-2-naphthoate octaprenyltransferase